MFGSFDYIILYFVMQAFSGNNRSVSQHAQCAPTSTPLAASKGRSGTMWVSSPAKPGHGMCRSLNKKGTSLRMKGSSCFFCMNFTLPRRPSALPVFRSTYPPSEGPRCARRSLSPRPSGSRRPFRAFRGSRGG